MTTQTKIFPAWHNFKMSDIVVTAVGYDSGGYYSFVKNGRLLGTSPDIVRTIAKRRMFHLR